MKDCRVFENPWASILISPENNVFSHLNSLYQAMNVKTQVIPELKQLLELSRDDTSGVIVAYKKLQEPKTQGSDDKNQDQPNAAFSPDVQNMDVLVTNMGNSKTSDLPYHFVSYLYKNGNLYELDSTKDGPVIISELSHDKDEKVDWIKPLVDYFEVTYTGRCTDLTFSAIIKTPVSHEHSEKPKSHVNPKGRATSGQVKGYNNLLKYWQKKADRQTLIGVSRIPRNFNDEFTSRKGNSSTTQNEDQPEDHDVKAVPTAEQGTEKNTDTSMEGQVSSDNNEEQSSVIPTQPEPEEGTEALEIASNVDIGGVPDTEEVANLEQPDETDNKQESKPTESKNEQVKVTVKRKNDDPNVCEQDSSKKSHVKLD